MARCWLCHWLGIRLCPQGHPAWQWSLGTSGSHHHLLCFECKTPPVPENWTWAWLYRLYAMLIPAIQPIPALLVRSGSHSALLQLQGTLLSLDPKLGWCWIYTFPLYFSWGPHPSDNTRPFLLLCSPSRLILQTWVLPLHLSSSL